MRTLGTNRSYFSSVIKSMCWTESINEGCMFCRDIGDRVSMNSCCTFFLIRDFCGGGLWRPAKTYFPRFKAVLNKVAVRIVVLSLAFCVLSRFKHSGDAQ